MKLQSMSATTLESISVLQQHVVAEITDDPRVIESIIGGVAVRRLIQYGHRVVKYGDIVSLEEDFEVLNDRSDETIVVTLPINLVNIADTDVEIRQFKNGNTEIITPPQAAIPLLLSTMLDIYTS